MPPRRLVILGLLPWACLASNASFEKTVQPFLKSNCLLCHNAKLKVGGLSLDGYANARAALQNREIWEKVIQKLRTGQMPPKGRPVPEPEQVAQVTHWFELEFARMDRSLKPDPGRVTARRLNRVEYNNTVRDLTGVDFKPAADFPPDDSGYGFDNIGDVLSLSPVLMEKYLAAAEKIARQAIVADPPPKPTQEKIEHTPVALGETPAIDLTRKHQFPVEGDYVLRGAVGGRRAAVFITLWLDGHQIQTSPVSTVDEAPRFVEARAHVTAGEHELKATIVHDDARQDAPADPDEEKPADKKKTPGRGPYVDRFEIAGPYNPHERPLTESHKRIFICGHANGQHRPECARLIVAALARRAYRRPVSSEEVDGLVRFVSMAQQQNDSFEQGVRVALEAVLVSPHFLFRIESDRDPNDEAAAHRVDDYELASRLSYFLWSTMPDEELFRLAGARKLHKPEVLSAQVRRMLLDAKASALVDNFAGQWLELRNLDSFKPDPERFPEFDEDLRNAMRQETRLFFEAVIHEDRSILDFIDGKYTFLNERLAKYYGIPGVAGKEFRRVALSGDERSGVLTQASVLMVSSYPTRTSPVLRGKWILENFLNDAPPPPPAGVPNLNEAAIGTAASQRQQLEQHRANPACAVCHTRMDPLGLGLENYDAVGRWRTKDGKFDIDSTGTLPGGRTFRSPAELKEILRSDRDAFAQCLAEKMLTYALGRGLERYDRPAVNLICRRLAASDYRFSRLVLGIVQSPPFEMRHGEAPGRTPQPTIAFSGGKP
jgi:Protein of unknown function (DUF1592)/Protein of unknown function (DUF1588)/Protein of unknown function (DUF1587)/Protein of unknown function (DUF1585)/Protein of unknown function (DUF1595)/Planctomycete cytochrome C